jgi:hypothetical protein
MRPRLTAQVLRGIARTDRLVVEDLAANGAFLALPARDRHDIETAWKWAFGMVRYRRERAKIRAADLNPKPQPKLRGVGNGRKSG